jgi:sarcosine oxidase
MVAPDYQKATACIYTVTNDWKFIFDFHPSNKNVIIASPCSGHGFKHSSAIGEILANMSTNTYNSLDLQPFSINKFKTNNLVNTISSGL